MAKQQNHSRVKTAETTFRIIEILKERSGATVTEVAENFELSKSSMHNYLTTLEREGYLIKDNDTYELGLRFLELGGNARRREQIYDVAKDKIDELAEETGEMANLLVEEHGRGIYLYRAKGENAVRTDSYIGQRVYLHTTALGKAILAHLPERRVDEIIDRHDLPEETDKTITDRESLRTSLEEVRQEGVAYDDEERLEGLRCVAVPIISRDDVVEGAISLSGPTSRFQEERFNTELPEKLSSYSNLIELDIKYS